MVIEIAKSTNPGKARKTKASPSLKIPKKCNIVSGERILVTSALPYIHSIPHLGNLIGSILPADIYYKYLRLAGRNAIFICGSDEHGAPMELKALKEGKTPEQLTDENHAAVKEALLRFGCTFTHYGRTHCKENQETTNEIFLALQKNGLIKEIVCKLPFCKNCKKTLPDRYVEGKCPYCGGLGRGDQCNDCGALLDPALLQELYCVLCGKKDIEFIDSKHLFIELPKLQDRLRAWVEGNKHWPPNAYYTSLEFLKQGLKERCISRDLSWGFPIPLKGFENKVFYVWFDAPIGYIGITREWSNLEGKPDEWKDWWQNPDTKIIHFMGKDNILFHTIFWPAFLMGSGLGYTLPHTIQSYEYLVAKGGVKFSKSKGVGLDIQSALEALPADYWRYVLVVLIPESSDSEFTLESLQNVVNSELNDNIGNFVHRTLTFINRFYDGKLPEANLGDDDRAVLEEARKHSDAFKSNMECIRLREGLKAAASIAKVGNTYLSAKEPWNLVKTDRAAAGTVLYVCANLIKQLAICLYPFIPKTSERIWNYLQLGDFSKVRFEEIGRPLQAGHKLAEAIEIQPLFSKITDKQMEEFRKKFIG
ncbi:MAG: methionine--tRNA ligase [Candidatus Micrarchaeia archaeon]